MQSQRVVWGRRSAFNVQKVLWLLDELALAYQHRDAGGEFGGLDEPAYQRHVMRDFEALRGRPL